MSRAPSREENQQRAQYTHQPMSRQQNSRWNNMGRNTGGDPESSGARKSLNRQFSSSNVGGGFRELSNESDPESSGVRKSFPDRQIGGGRHMSRKNAMYSDRSYPNRSYSQTSRLLPPHGFSRQNRRGYRGGGEMYDSRKTTSRQYSPTRGKRSLPDELDGETVERGRSRHNFDPNAEMPEFYRGFNSHLLYSFSPSPLSIPSLL